MSHHRSSRTSITDANNQEISKNNWRLTVNDIAVVTNISQESLSQTALNSEKCGQDEFQTFERESETALNRNLSVFRMIRTRGRHIFTL